ncbi:hypothetical protein BGW39_009725 [Mortierella sp. 14UC]|nr:hypothetical protein BGW39_009725 [Mortierella sp. 14UC]
MDPTRTSPSLAVFSCPELCHIIALSLKQTDLYSCLLVNKTLSKNMFSYLWRHITFSDFGPYYSELYVHDALEKGQRLSEQEQEQEMQGRSQAGGDSDMRDKGKDKYGKLSAGTTASLDSQQPQESPTFERQERRVRPQERLFGKMTNPWTVPEELQDASDLYFPFSPPYNQLVKHGHLVETLTLEWDEGLDFLMDAEMEALSESKQEEPPGLMQSRIYIRLMEQCRNVRVLKVVTRNPELPYRPPSWALCGTAMMAIHCARERRLVAKDGALAKVIVAAGRLGVGPQSSSSSRIENVDALSDDERAPLGLGIREFHLSGSCGFSRESFKALICAFSPPPPAVSSTQSHSHPRPRPQLRVLDISACEFIQSDQMRTLVTLLPGLRVVDFRCRQHLLALLPDSGLKYGYGYGNLWQADEDDPVRARMKGRHEEGRWACQDSLRVLRIGVKEAHMRNEVVDLSPFTPAPASGTGASTIPPPMSNSKPGGPFDVLTSLAYPACFGWFYDHIARLVNLRELCLVSVKDPSKHRRVTTAVRLTLEEGLDRWSGLKELEVLDVEYLQHQIGVEEVQWMVEHWPRLRVIRGLVFEEDTVDKNADVGMEAEEDEKGSAAWSEGVRWLKMTRPDIELPVLKKRWRGANLFDFTDEEYL